MSGETFGSSYNATGPSDCRASAKDSTMAPAAVQLNPESAHCSSTSPRSAASEDDANGPRRRELEVFEDDNFVPEAYVLDRLRPVEEEEETSWRFKLCGAAAWCCAKEAEKYDCAAYTKNELRVMIAELKDLQRISAKQMIKSLIAHHTLFIRTSREVADLEEDILKLRSLLRTRAAVVRSLAIEQWSVPIPNTKPSALTTLCYASDEPGPSKLEDLASTLPDILDILLAERKVDQALVALEEGEHFVLRGYSCTGRAGELSPITPVTAAFLQVALMERRARLVEYLGTASQQPSVRGVELRAAIAALNRLSEGPRAHTLLLHSHHGRLEHNVRGLRPSGTSYGGAFTAALSQMAFSAIAQAARDSLTVFGEVPAYASELVVWARTVTQFYAGLIKQHVLSAAAAAGGLRAAAECVQIAFGHCSLLEAHGLAMCPLLSKFFRPSVEQAMEANLKRIEESVTAMASADDWMPTFNPSTLYCHSRLASSRHSRCSNPGSFKISSSAHQFNSMAQDFMEGVSPVISMQLAGVALEGLSLQFSHYIDMLIRAVPDPAGNGREQTAGTEAQQLTLVSNATALADELLPRAAFKLLPGGGSKKAESYREFCEEACAGFSSQDVAHVPELKDWRQKLHKGVKRLQDRVCKHHVRHLLYCTNKHEVQLTPDTYLVLDVEGHGSSWLHQDPMPSAVFQSLFARVTSINKTGEAMAVSKERVVSPLLARILEVFVCWLDEEKFWNVVEDGPRRLGPVGLQQFVLDMQFVIQMASSGNCGSRFLRALVPDVTSRAVHAFVATGADPDSVLPNDDWFLETARNAVHKLTDGWNRATILPEIVEEVAVFEVPPAPDERMPRDF